MCAVGGGQDGFELAKAFIEATLPVNWTGLLITGALMPEAQREILHNIAHHRPNMKVVDFVPEPLKLMKSCPFRTTFRWRCSRRTKKYQNS